MVSEVKHGSFQASRSSGASRKSFIELEDRSSALTFI